MDSHGIFSVGIVEKYQLGFVADPLPGDERFRGMLAIPYLTRSGGVRAIRFRNLVGGKPKIAQHSGQEVRLYNTLALFDAADLIGIAEGEADAICATERLGIPTVGIPGAEMFKAHKDIWAPVFKDFGRVLVFRDGDDAGKNLAETVTDALRWRVQVIDPPDGEDISSMVATGRADELTAKLADSNEEDWEVAA